jgi:hypothetical protein
MPEVPGVEETGFYVHSPWAVVTVSDACPWIGGKSSADVATCSRPCREGSVALREPSMGVEMLQRGKARFVAGGPGDSAFGESRTAVAFVKYPCLP